MKNTNWTPRFTRLLIQEGLIKRQLQILDVGARGGPPAHWNLYGPMAKVHGFEPDADECERLNRLFAINHETYAQYECYPVALSDRTGSNPLFVYDNAAANSFTPPPAFMTNTGSINVETWRFDEFAAARGINHVDFVKIDVEHHEMPVLDGLGAYLEAGQIFGLEIEVHFVPQGDVPLFSDIELALRKRGYHVFDLDLFRDSFTSLVAWDHRDHNEKPILGPTLTGSIVHADAVFFRTEHLTEPPFDVERLLTLASLFEIHGFSDRALNVLKFHRATLEPVVRYDALVRALVPNHYGDGLSLEEYVAAYRKYAGRPAVTSVLGDGRRRLVAAARAAYRILREGV